MADDGKRRPFDDGRGLSRAEQRSRALQVPEGVGRDRPTFGHMLDMAGRRMKTNAASKVREAETRYIRAEEEQGRALEALMRQADRVLNIEDIIEDDRVRFQTSAARNRTDYDEALHEADTADMRRERQKLEEEIRLERVRRELAELRAPKGEPKDNRARIAELAEMIELINLQLASDALPEEQRALLKKKRRALNDELDLLKARE